MSPNQLLSWLNDHPEEMLAVDTETDGLHVHDGRSKCIGISIACSKGSAYYGIDHGVGENVPHDTVLQLDWVLTQGRRLVFANRMFDVLSLETIGIYTDEIPFYDIFTMSRIIDPSSHDKEITLADLGRIWLGRPGKIVDWPHEVYVEGRKTPIAETTLAWQKKNGWPDTTPEMMYEYARVDAVETYDICLAILSHRHWKANPDSVWERKQKTMRTTTEMRRRGVLVDMPLVVSELEKGEIEQERIKEEIGFNPKSHKDNIRIYIDELGLPPLNISKKTGLSSFAKATMEEYEPILARMDSPLAQKVKAYKGWSTACGLLLRPYSVLTSPDGRIRTEFTTHVTATGRLSSKKPNLQQISKEADVPWKKNIKRCFVAKPGFVLLSADYSQLELRIAAHYADEASLKKVFAEGRDIFTEMSQELGMTRNDTKTFVYSIQYGAGIPRIMNAFGVSEVVARRMRAKFYRTYPGFRALDAACRDRAGRQLAIRLWSGRIRRFQYPSENYKAMNALIQGGAADVVEDVWNHIMETLDNEDCRVLLQVHDALVFEVREDLVDYYRPLIQSTMENVQGITGKDFDVKFAVEVSDWALAA